MLTETQLVDVRRHLRYGPVGNLPEGGSFISYRFFVEAGQLEYRLGHLSAAEELVLLGNGDDQNPVNPNYTDPTTSEVHQGYLNICNYLEGQVGVANDNYDIEKAGDYTARKNETSLRVKNYNWWVMRMAQFLMLRINPVRVRAPGGVGLVA